jgi:hypothetical protein
MNPQEQGDQSETVVGDHESRVQTARWVAVSILGLAIVTSSALVFSWRTLKHSQVERKALSAEIQASRDSYRSAVTSLQQQVLQVRTQNLSLQAALNDLNLSVQLAQSGIALTRKEAQRLNDGQREAIRQFSAMDREVKKQLATKASSEDVTAMGSEVTSFRNDLTSTKNDLQMTRSEMGTLIARNHDDIEVLRRLGERDYFEFTIAGKNIPQKLGDFTIELRSTDAKKDQCSLVFVVDDKRIEKRDRSTNEPIFFYARGARQPTEVVINEIEKNKVVGYLSVPKERPQIALAGAN